MGNATMLILAIVVLVLVSKQNKYNNSAGEGRECVVHPRISIFIEELYLCVSDLNPTDSFLSAEKTSFLCWCAWRFLHAHQYTLTLVLNDMDAVVHMKKKGRKNACTYHRRFECCCTCWRSQQFGYAPGTGTGQRT